MPQQMFQRPRRFKRRPRSRKRPFNSSQVKAIKKLSVARQDMKFKSDNISSTVLTTSTAYYMSLDALLVAQGVANNQRIGDRIDIKDIEYRTDLHLISPFTTFYHNAVRMLIVQFPEGKTTQLNSIFQNLIPNDFLPTLDETDGVKYKVLHDKSVVIGPFQPRKEFVHRVKASDLIVKTLEYESGSTTLLKGDVVMYITPTNSTTESLEASSNWKLRYYG